MSSRTCFTCDVCGREVLAAVVTGHNPLGLPEGFLQIQITGRERILETLQRRSDREYRPEKTDDQLEEGAP